MTPINAINMNCRGLVDGLKRVSVFNWHNRHPKGKFDMVLLQEVHSTDEPVNQLVKTWGRYEKYDKPDPVEVY